MPTRWNQLWHSQMCDSWLGQNIGKQLRKAILGIKSKSNETYSTEGIANWKYFIDSPTIDNFWFKLNNDSLKLIEEIKKIF